MEQQQDKLVICKCCGSNACYESEFTLKDGKVTTWLCMTCGFTTNTTMTKDSESLKQTLELTAELIKDLRQDHDDLAWFPTAITMPDKGMIFPEPVTMGELKFNVFFTRVPLKSRISITRVFTMCFSSPFNNFIKIFSLDFYFRPKSSPRRLNKIKFNKQTGPLLWRYIRYF